MIFFGFCHVPLYFIVTFRTVVDFRQRRLPPPVALPVLRCCESEIGGCRVLKGCCCLQECVLCIRVCHATLVLHELPVQWTEFCYRTMHCCRFLTWSFGIEKFIQKSLFENKMFISLGLVYNLQYTFQHFISTSLPGTLSCPSVEWMTLRLLIFYIQVSENLKQFLMSGFNLTIYLSFNKYKKKKTKHKKIGFRVYILFLRMIFFLSHYWNFSPL